MAEQLTVPAPRARPVVRTDWPDLSEHDLLKVRLCDLGLSIAGSWLEPRIAQLEDELSRAGLTFKPHFWLAAEWFTPDGVPGVAIPFYLAHPRLMKLERAQMLDVEGGTEDWCMQILRHEVGHAIDNAYELRRRHRRVRLFGKPSTPYPEYYLPRPYSRSYVVHLDSWYAQSHPDEDFAETFAVWMTPDADWRERYKDWPTAARKLDYMAALMREIGPKPPLVSTRRTVENISRLRTTLGGHYRRKRAHYGIDYPDFSDRELRRLFSDGPEHRQNPKAARFIQRARRETRRIVAEWTGLYQYTIDRVIADMIQRADELGLRLRYPVERTKLDFTILVTVQTMNHLHKGRHRVAL